ncbi:hypothetical protein GVAV_000447 [Gurleya vavrai]
MSFLIYFFLYIAILYVNKNVLNFLFKYFFVAVGYYSIVSNIFYLYEFTEYEIEKEILHENVSSSEFSELLIDENIHQRRKKKFGLKRWLRKCKKAILNTIYNLTLRDAAIYLIAFCIVMFYIVSENWLLTDIISGSICFSSIREIKLDSVMTGFIHLSILFIYDIIILNNKQHIDKLLEGIKVPIQIVFPQNLKGFDLISTGDIFMPGLFIAVVKRYCDKNNTRGIFVLTYLGFCIGVFLVIIISYIFELHIQTMLIVCPVLVMFSLFSAMYYDHFNSFIRFRRKNI